MGFEKITAYLDALDTKAVPGTDIIVYKDHKELYRHYTGFRDREKGLKMDGTELYWAYSCTKVLTVTAAMQLFEKGLINLDDAVGKYIPAYDTLAVCDNGRIRAPRTAMTVRQLFTMTAGLTYDLDTPSIQKALFYSGGKADTLTLVKAFAEEPLAFDPGEHYRYSLCHDVLAGIVEKVSGEKYRDYVRNHILEPLGMSRSGFQNENPAEFAQQYLYDQKTKLSSPCGLNNVFRLSGNYDSGGAGLYTCVNDYILLSDALACGGVGASGKQILKAPTVDLIRLPQLSDSIRAEFNRDVANAGRQYSYGFGVRTMVDKELSPASPVGEFGWDGAAGAYTLIDPENRLSIYLGMHILAFNYEASLIQHDVRDLVYEALKGE